MGWGISLDIPDTKSQEWRFDDFIGAASKAADIVLSVADTMGLDRGASAELLAKFWKSSNSVFRLEVIDSRFRDGHLCTIVMKPVSCQLSLLEV